MFVDILFIIITEIERKRKNFIDNQEAYRLDCIRLNNDEKGGFS